MQRACSYRDEKGSTFYLELPLVETFAQKEEIPKEAIVSTPVLATETTSSTAKKFRPNILIAEDNADLRQFLTMILQEDYNVIAVENGEEALAALRVASYGLPVDKQNIKDKQQPADDEKQVTDNGQRATDNSQLATRNCQLIISDIMMPIMGGIELLTKVKTTKELQHIPMIMLTARQSLDVKIEALRIGVDDYLTKPFREEELKARVANLIKNSQNRSTLDQTKTTPKILRHTVSPQDLEWLKELETIITDSLGKSTFKLTDTTPEMNISYRRLQQKLKIITGLTPKQYQRIIMLTRARQILKSGKVQTVKEVVYQLGLDNHHHFSKLYKQEFGIMPSEELK